MCWPGSTSCTRKKEAEVGSARMRDNEKMILLRVVDNRWMDHIDAMDELKQGIGLRSLGQVNPVNAYASEGFDMFEAMVAEIREEAVRYCYNVTANTTTQRRQVIVIGEGRKDEFRDDAAAMSDGRRPSAQQSMPQAAPTRISRRSRRPTGAKRLKWAVTILARAEAERNTRTCCMKKRYGAAVS